MVRMKCPLALKYFPSDDEIPAGRKAINFRNLLAIEYFPGNDKIKYSIPQPSNTWSELLKVQPS